jgi:hypothetical protein
MLKQIRYKLFTTGKNELSSRSCKGHKNPSRIIMTVSNELDSTHQWPDHVHT